jgi:hypothetical protein
MGITLQHIDKSTIAEMGRYGISSCRSFSYNVAGSEESIMLQLTASASKREMGRYKIYRVRYTE